MAVERLKAQDLRLFIEEKELGFERLSQFEAEGSLEAAQGRAVRALDFGLKMEHPSFHVFVAGAAETGAAEMAASFVEEVARCRGRELWDWCYLHNFRRPDEPLAVRLPAGKGRELKGDMAALIEDLKLQIPKVFEGETYVARKEEVIQGFNQARNQVFEELDKAARERGFRLQADQTGMMVIPVKEDGSPYTHDEISKLPQEEQERLKRASEELHKEMGAAMRRIHHLEQQVQRDLKDLDKELVRQLAAELIQGLREKYQGVEGLEDYFDQVLEDVVENMGAFRPKPQGPMPFPFPGSEPSFTQYEVNVLVDNGDTQGVPVIVENSPSYPNLFGTVEKRAQFGAFFSDFTMIKPGAFHRANGGFLILKAVDLLKWPFSYETLKRTLRERLIRVEDPAEHYGLFTTKALKPMPIPLDIKVVLVGEPRLYHLLYGLDSEFRELFKVKAHLDVRVDRGDETVRQFLGGLRAMVEEEGLLDIHCSGAARLLEESARRAGEQEKLSLEVAEMADLVREADYWARQEGAELITGDHVRRAVEERRYRASLYADRLQESLQKGIIKVATSGEAVGQVNGLAVYDLGDYSFGKPSRITANISLGKEGVINIEREAELSGNIHTKGVMILAGYLRERFASDKPLSLTATICFEQSYGMVDGDSASGAELFCLLSALSGVPIRQGIAVTGAVSQKGEILPIGGVNEKIEGFFELCQVRGLDGSQGVIIPEANRRDLMLREEVVEAVQDGRFHVWAVSTVEEALEILTGREAGVRREDGTWPEDSIFGLVDRKLTELAEEARAFAQDAAPEEGDEEVEEGEEDGATDEER